MKRLEDVELRCPNKIIKGVEHSGRDQIDGIIAGTHPGVIVLVSYRK